MIFFQLFVISSLLYFAIIFSIFVMVIYTDGADEGLLQLTTLKKWPSFRTFGMMVTLTTINLKLISPVGHMTFAAFINPKDEKQHKTGACLFVELLHLLCGVVHIVIVAMIAGVLSTLYGVDNAVDMFVPRNII